jgi:hypothetical protein
MKTPQSLLCVFILLISLKSDAKSSVRRNGQTPRGLSRNSVADGSRELQANRLSRKGPAYDPTVGGKGTTASENGPPDGGTPVPYPAAAGAPSTAPNEDGDQPDSSGPVSPQNPITPTPGPTFVPTSPTLSPTTPHPTEQQTQPPQEPAPTLAPPTSNPSPQPTQPPTPPPQPSPEPAPTLAPPISTPSPEPTQPPTAPPAQPSPKPTPQTPTPQQTLAPAPQSTPTPTPQLPDASTINIATPGPHQGATTDHSPQMGDPAACAAAAQRIDVVTTKYIRVTYLYELLTQADSSLDNVANFLDTAIQGFLATSLVTCDATTSTPVGDVRGISASELDQDTGDACTGITLYDPALLSCYVMNGTMVVSLSPASILTEEAVRTQVWDTLRADFNSKRRRRLAPTFLNPDAGIVGLYFLSQEDPTVDPLNRGNVRVGTTRPSRAQSTKSGLGLGTVISAGLVGGAIFLLSIIGFVYVKKRGAGRRKTGHKLWTSFEREDASATPADLEEDVISEPGALDSGFDDGYTLSIEFLQFPPSTENALDRELGCSWSTSEESQLYNYSSTSISMTSSRLGGSIRKQGHSTSGALSEKTTGATTTSVAEQWERGATIKPVAARSDRGDDSTRARIYPIAEGDTVDF